MTVAATPDLQTALRRAAVRATLAPSIHNTQPWRFRLGAGWLEIEADPSRQLPTLDPTGRQLLLSGGCALFNARVALAASGVRVVVDRMPDRHRPELLARIRVHGAPAVRADPGGAHPATMPDEDIGALDRFVESRRSNRRRFADEPVPDGVTASLVAAAAAEDAVLSVVSRPDDRLAVAVLSQRADTLQNEDPDYRAELRAWAGGDPGRRDGVPACAVPHGAPGPRTEVPIRDFGPLAGEGLPPDTRSSRQQCLLVLGTRSDTRRAWLRAGEALERVLLEITRHGYAASPLPQAIEVDYTRAALRRELRLGSVPQMLLRVGRAPQTPAPRRRRLVDMLTETDLPAGQRPAVIES